MHDVYFSQDSIGNSLLAIDLQWDLPDFANIGHYISNRKHMPPTITAMYPSTLRFQRYQLLSGIPQSCV